MNDLILIENAVLSLQDSIPDNIELNSRELTYTIKRILEDILDIVSYLKEN